MAEDYIRVADASDLPPGELMRAEAHGYEICLANVAGEVVAVSNECPHASWAPGHRLSGRRADRLLGPQHRLQHPQLREGLPLRPGHHDIPREGGGRRHLGWRPARRKAARPSTSSGRNPASYTPAARRAD